MRPRYEAALVASGIFDDFQFARLWGIARNSCHGDWFLQQLLFKLTRNGRYSRDGSLGLRFGQTSIMSASVVGIQYLDY